MEEFCQSRVLRTLRVRPYPGSMTVSVEAPHAYGLSTSERTPFERAAILEAVARVDLSGCAESPGPRAGEALVVTTPAGGVADVFVRGPSADQPLGKCI